MQEIIPYWRSHIKKKNCVYRGDCCFIIIFSSISVKYIFIECWNVKTFLGSMFWSVRQMICFLCGTVAVLWMRKSPFDRMMHSTASLNLSASWINYNWKFKPIPVYALKKGFSLIYLNIVWGAWHRRKMHRWEVNNSV